VGPFDAVVVVTGEASVSGPVAGWRGVLDAHSGVTASVLAHAAWLRAASRYARDARRSVRIVHVVAADTPGGRTSAQAVAQMCRSVNDALPGEVVEAFAVAVEDADAPAAQAAAALAVRLARADDGRSLKGAELVVRPGWMGLRGHPAPLATVTFGGPDIPPGASDALRAALREWSQH
jgi:hypothetical protein